MSHTNYSTSAPDQAGVNKWMGRAPRLFAQICALNEQENIGQVIQSIPREIPGISSVQVLVIDDGSTDHTVAVAAAAGADFVLHHNVRKGLARAFQDGMDACLSRGADIIVNIDADGQYDGAEIPLLIAPILTRKADVVVGNRQVHTLQHFSPQKRVLERIGSAVVQIASGVVVTDAVSGFRAYARDAALRLFVTSNFSYTIQSLIQAGKLGLAVADVPIHARETTRPSRLHRGTLNFINQQSTVLIRTYVTYEPLKTFSLLSAIFLLIGAALLVRLVILAAGDGGQFIGHIQSLLAGVFSVIIGVLLFLTGITADRIRENRRMIEEVLYRIRQQTSEPGPQGEPISRETDNVHS
jgi:glycosyltransferase involved in cell wall biosynthesis